MVVYGSYARGELATGSDVDLLVVLAEGVPITRALYRQWEGVVPAWNGREVDLHFVHLPKPGAPVSGSWAEAAICGIVLFEQDLAVSRRLVGIRQHIAAGSRMLRRDRKLAFYGAEDLTPSGFYTREDATTARDIARQTVAAVEPHVAPVE